MQYISSYSTDIVTEYMSGGNLLELLKENKVQITVNHMISMAKQTGSGIYLSVNSQKRDALP